MATLVISYLRTLVYNPHKALANCFGVFGGHVIKQNLFSPKGRLFWNVKCQLDFFHFLGEKRKKSATALHRVMPSEQGVTLHL